MSPAGIQGRDAAAIAPTPLGNVPKYAAAAKGGQDLRRRLSGLQHQREGYGRQRAMGLDDMSRRFGDMRRQVPGQFNDLASQQWGAEQAYAGQRMGGVMDDASRRAVLAAQIRNA